MLRYRKRYLSAGDGDDKARPDDERHGDVYASFRLILASFDYEPGQFVEVSVAGLGEAPISISSSPTQKGGFELVIRNVGNVTNGDPQDESRRQGRHPRAVSAKALSGRRNEGKKPCFHLRRHRACAAAVVYQLCAGSSQGLRRGDDSAGNKVSLMQRFFREELAGWSHRDDIHFMETIDQADDCWNGNVGVVTTLIPKIETELTNGGYIYLRPAGDV